MKKNLTVIFFILAIFGCKQKFYRAGSSSMEKTLMTGQRFLMTETKQFNWNDLVVFNIYSDDYSKP